MTDQSLGTTTRKIGGVIVIGGMVNGLSLVILVRDSSTG